MKRYFNSVVLALAVASACCMGAACKKKSSESEEGKKTTSEPPVSSTLPSEEEKPVERDEPLTENTTVDLHRDEYQIEMAKPPVSTRADGSSVYQSKEDALGYGNSCNGSLATGNSEYHFFVVHPEAHIIAIEMEKLSTGESYFIYSPKPVKDHEQSIDMLTLYDHYLYFREDMSEIKRIDLLDFSISEIAEGAFSRMIVYDDSLFLGEESTIVRYDLDGSNRTVLFTAKFADHPVDIAFCINDDKILFSDPQHEREDGLVYGSLFSMDLDGKNRKEILPDVIAGNDDVFFSDGENIYFYGIMPRDPDMKMLSDPDMKVVGNSFVTTYSPGEEDAETDTMISGFFCVKLDGSETTFIQSYKDGSVNVIDGLIFWSAGDTIFVEGEGVYYDKIGDMKIFEVDDIIGQQFVIVGDWIYYSNIDPDMGDEGRTRRSYLGGGWIDVVDWPSVTNK